MPKGLFEEYAEHMAVKIGRICSTLDSSLRAESMEVIRTTSYKVIWAKCEPVEPEEVDRALSAAGLATCVLDLCPSWLMKASQERMHEWIWLIVNSSLREKMVLSALKEIMVCPCLKGPLLKPASLNSFCPVSNLSFLGKVVKRVLYGSFKEDWRK